MEEGEGLVTGWGERVLVCRPGRRCGWARGREVAWNAAFVRKMWN